MKAASRAPTVIALGLAQTLSWASCYYLLAILAVPIARDLGTAVSTVFGAFSVSLLVSAALGPTFGRAIDRWDGRPVLMATSLVFALGLTALGLARGTTGLFVAWAILGIAMASGLYEAAFAALVRLYGSDSRDAITGITLFAGFASTLGWPLSTLLEAQVGWRNTCFVWAALHLVIGLPLNWSLPKPSAVAAARPALPIHASGVVDGEVDPVGVPGPNGPLAADHGKGPDAGRATFILALVFAAAWFVSTAMAAHLPRLLQLCGSSLAAAIAVGALVGPAQVAGRLLEFGVLRRIHPLLSARLAALLHPVGAAMLALLGAPMAVVFALLHGAGNGILTIAKGTLPLVLFGPAGYGERQGVLMVPARVAQALAPWLFGICLDRWGSGALWLSAAIAAVAFVALLFLRRAAHPVVRRTPVGASVI